MKISYKPQLIAVAMAALVPACYIVTEKPADSAPPPVATAVPTAQATNPPLATATATVTAVPTVAAPATATPTAVPTTASTLPVPGAIIGPPKPPTVTP